MSSVKMKMPAWVKALTLIGVLLSPAPISAQTSDLVSQSSLRVCADPANAPMSDKEGKGYENTLAEFIAAKLDLPLKYEWYPMSTGFIRNSLRANKCDLVIGYAQGHEMVLNTNHYLTSAYTIVTRKGDAIAAVDTLGDSRLKGLDIGVVAGSPPATHMARNGLIKNAQPYDLVVDRRHESPIIDMLDDLNTGEIDAALLWGPIAGPLVKTDYPDLQVTPLLKETLPPRLFFRITMGVRQGEKVWQRKLNSLIRRNQGDINAILIEAGVPLLTDMGTEMLDVSQ